MKPLLRVVSWVSAVVLSVLLGVALVQYLVAPSLTMAAFAVACTLLALALIVLVSVGFRRWARLLAVGVILIGLVAGYLVSGMTFLNRTEERHLAPLNPPLAEQRDHAAVIYFTHGEPTGYDPSPWIETLQEFDADQVPFMPKFLRPLFFHSFRAEYLKLGGSPHNYIQQAMVRSLEERYRAQGDDKTRFYLAFLDAKPRPDEVAIRAINEGANKLAIATVFVTVSNHTQAGKDQITALGLDAYGVPVCYGDPLWDSETLQQMFVARANANLNGMDKSQVGVLLAGHGQPDEWDKTFPTETEQEQLFLDAIKQRLIADGYQAENISQGWMDFKKPEVGDAARRLAIQGVKKIFVFAAAISASSLHSLYDIPEQVTASGLSRDVEVVNLGAWDDDPLVIQAIKEHLDACK